MKKITKLEMISVVSDCNISGLLYGRNCYFVETALQNAEGFYFNPELTVANNLLAYAEKQGFGENLKKAAQEYADFIKREKPHALLNTAWNAEGIAKKYSLPDIEVEQREVVEPTPAKPHVNLLKVADCDWGTEKVTCRFCGKVLPSWREDSSGFSLGHEDCDCAEYQEANEHNKSLL